MSLITVTVQYVSSECSLTYICSILIAVGTKELMCGGCPFTLIFLLLFINF